MSRLLLATPYLTVEDSNGVPVSGALVSTYLTGTSTPTPLYADATSGTTLSNPAACDSSGRLVAYIDRAISYKVVITDANAVAIKTIDPVLYPAVPATPTTYEVPIGTILPYAGASAPTGYLLCDGSAVSRTVYSALLAVTLFRYGSGDGSSTFNLPNMVGKFPFGTASSGTGSTLGGSFGTIDHVHAHTHTVAAHAHSVTPHAAGLAGVSGSGIADTTTVTSGTASLTTDSGGGAATANPPGLAISFIIKY